MLLPVQLDQQEMKAFLEIVLTIKWAYVLMFSEALYDLTYSTGHQSLSSLDSWTDCLQKLHANIC